MLEDERRRLNHPRMHLVVGLRPGATFPIGTLLSRGMHRGQV